jgi:hypothetical protein
VEVAICDAAVEVEAAIRVAGGEHEADAVDSRLPGHPSGQVVISPRLRVRAAGTLPGRRVVGNFRGFAVAALISPHHPLPTGAELGRDCLDVHWSSHESRKSQGAR